MLFWKFSYMKQNNILKNSKGKCKNCRGTVMFRWLHTHTVDNSSHTLEACARYHGNIFYVCLFEPISLKSEKSRLNLSYFLWKLVFVGLRISVKVGWLRFLGQRDSWVGTALTPPTPPIITVHVYRLAQQRWLNSSVPSSDYPSWLCLASAMLSGTLATNPSRALDRQTWQPRRDLERTKTGTGQRSTLLKTEDATFRQVFKKDVDFKVLLKFFFAACYWD